MTRLKIGKVVRQEDREFQERRVLRMMLCQGEVDGVEGEFCLRLWSRDGGESFEGEEDAAAGREVFGAKPKDERYQKAMGAAAFDWKPSRRGGAGVGALAAVAMDFLAEWVSDRRMARDLERERFEFGKRAKIAELTVAAMNASNRDKVSFRETYRFMAGLLTCGTEDGSLG